MSQIMLCMRVVCRDVPWGDHVRMDADSVLELPPHTVFNSGTRLGDRFEMRLKTAKATNGACTKDPQAVA